MQSIMPVSKCSWMVHVLGLERLFALRGPLKTKSSNKLDRALLASCRPVMIFGAFFMQRPSLMAEPMWKDTLQPQDPDESPDLYYVPTAASDLSFLLDILADIPSLFVQCNDCIRLAKTKPAPPLSERITKIWAKVRQLQQDLEVWRARWCKDHDCEIYEALPITTVESIEVTAWTTVFSFSGPELAVTFSMYHSVVILLASIPKSLLEFGLLETIIPNDSMDSLSQPHVENSVHSICRSIEYYLHSLDPSQAPVDFYLYFPMHVARRASIQLGLIEELAWLSSAFQVMFSKFPEGIWANKDFANRFSGLQEGLFG